MIMSRKFLDDRVIKNLRNKKPVSAAWAQLGSNASAEILAESGFDALIIDMEHAPITTERLVSMIQATKGTDCIPIVRTPWNDMVVIKQILDAGAYGVHIPYVSTKEEAEYAVKSCKYPPEGWRGIAGSQRAVNYSLNKADYYRRANSDIMVMVAIETPEGVENIEDIVSVEGLDGIFIGPADLSTCMGYRADPSVPAVQDAIRKIEKTVFKSDKFLGTVAADMASAKILYARGYSLIYFMSDVTSIAAQAVKQLTEFNEFRKAST
jgi:2-dehydro-3-deoxyglucarate aldolase/4-hydroxy-2-oxoheptanedioate aldolase